MKSQTSPISHYISSQAKDIQPLLRKIRATVQAAAPKAIETMSYGIPTFDYSAPKHQSEHLVHFAAFKKHIGFFPTPSAIVEFENELAALNLTTSKGTVQFPFEIFTSPKSNAQAFSIIKKMTSWRVKMVAKNDAMNVKAKVKIKTKDTPKAKTRMARAKTKVKAKVEAKSK